MSLTPTPLPDEPASARRIFDAKVILALVVLVITALVIAAVLSGLAKPDQKDVVMIILTGVFSFTSLVLGYFFGSSAGSADKNATLSAMAQKSSGTLSAHWLPSLLGLLLLGGMLAGCGDKAPSLASEVYTAKAAYEAALIGAVKYNNLPRCPVAPANTLCSDVGAIAEIRKGAHSAKDALDAAEAIVRTPHATGAAAIVSDATHAVAALQSILARYGVAQTGRPL